MNIKGHGEVSAIRLSHKGNQMRNQMNFERILPVVYMEGALVEPSTIAFVEFKDITEIDAMIYMLNQFKNACVDEMGKWRRA